MEGGGSSVGLALDSRLNRKVFANPGNIPALWPFIVTNPFGLSYFRWYMERFGASVEAVIYDSGVGVFKSGVNGGSYPPGYLRRYIEGLHEAHRIVREHASSAALYYVIPDVPGEYVSHPLNVFKTLEYIRSFKRISKSLPGIPVPVVQGGRDQPGSLVRTYLSHRDVYDEFELVALGRVSSKPRVTAKSVALFDQVASRPFHALGVSLRALKYLEAWGLAGCRLASIEVTVHVSGIPYGNGRGGTSDATAAVLLERMNRIQRVLEGIPCRPGLVEWLEPPRGDPGLERMSVLEVPRASQQP